MEILVWKKCKQERIAEVHRQNTFYADVPILPNHMLSMNELVTAQKEGYKYADITIENAWDPAAVDIQMKFKKTSFILILQEFFQLNINDDPELTSLARITHARPKLKFRCRITDLTIMAEADKLKCLLLKEEGKLSLFIYYDIVSSVVAPGPNPAPGPSPVILAHAPATVKTNSQGARIPG